jgi:protein MAK11
MNIIHTISHPSRIHDIKFSKGLKGDGEMLLVGAEDKKVTVYDVSKEPNAVPSIIAEMIGHSNR